MKIASESTYYRNNDELSVWSYVSTASRSLQRLHYLNTKSKSNPDSNHNPNSNSLFVYPMESLAIFIVSRRIGGYVQTSPARYTSIERAWTCDRFGAEFALLGEQLTEARHTVWFVVVRRELVVCEDLGAVGATKTLSVPRRLLVRHPALRYRLKSPDKPPTNLS